MKSYTLTLTVGIECPKIEASMPSQRLMEVTVAAPSVSPTSNRPSLNLALVLDRSGSMTGDKLAYVKEAACHVLNQLDERDRVAIIAYDNEVRKIASSKPISRARREDLKQRIHAIQPGGSTDLGSGWLRGAGEVAEHLLPQGVNRTLLMTDGLANQGITDQNELAHHAHQLKVRGISTSTFGVGYDFNEHLLEAMAARGGGHFFFIESPHQIPALFQQELSELLTVVAREAYLTLPVPIGVAAQLLGDLPCETVNGQMKIPVGDLSSGQQRAFYLQLLTAPGTPGMSLAFPVTLAYVDLETNTKSLTSTVTLTYVSATEVKNALRDMALLRRAAEVQVSTAINRALVQERQGQRKEAAETLQRELATQAPYLDQETLAPGQDLAGRIAQGLDEFERKQQHAETYKRRYSRR